MNRSVHTILIIDDEKFVRQSIADYFEDQLWQTLQAESGEQALELLEEESPDCAVVDIRLQGMDGNEFIREAYKKMPNMAVVICTGSPDYYPPKDLSERPLVSDRMFIKPVSDMAELEKELLRIISRAKNRLTPDC